MPGWNNQSPGTRLQPSKSTGKRKLNHLIDGQRWLEPLCAKGFA